MNFDFKSTFIVNKTAAWFSLTALITLSLKGLYEWSSAADMAIAAEPTAYLLGLIFNTQPVHLTDSIALPSLHIALNKYTVGANFFILGFFVLANTIPHHALRKGQSVLAIAGVAFTLAFLTLVVNVTRIACIVSFQKFFHHTDIAVPHWFFRVESISIHVFFLVVSFLIFKNSLLKYFRRLTGPNQLSC